MCDRCLDWFHALCLEILKPAIKALERFDCPAWLCICCKSELKKGKKKDPRNSSPSELLEAKFSQLEKALKSHMELVTNAIQAQEKVVHDHAASVERSVQLCEKFAKDQAKSVEQTFQQQTASYADAVKGTCNEVARVVQTQIASLPKLSNEGKAAKDLSRAPDDHIDRNVRPTWSYTTSQSRRAAQ